MEDNYRDLFVFDWDLRLKTQQMVPYYYFLFVWNFIYLVLVLITKGKIARNDPGCICVRNWIQIFV